MARFFALIIALLGAAALSQGPEFSQQYMQRLAGAVDELREFALRFDDDAEAAGIDRQTALAAYESSGDFLSTQGVRIEDTLARYERLDAHLTELREAGEFGRTWMMVSERDLPLLRATADDYQPAVPLTLAGAGHAGIGFVIGWIVGAFIAGVLGLIFGMGRRREYA